MQGAASALATELLSYLALGVGTAAGREGQGALRALWAGREAVVSAYLQNRAGGFLRGTRVAGQAPPSLHQPHTLGQTAPPGFAPGTAAAPPNPAGSSQGHSPRVPRLGTLRANPGGAITRWSPHSMVDDRRTAQGDTWWGGVSRDPSPGLSSRGVLALRPSAMGALGSLYSAGNLHPGGSSAGGAGVSGHAVHGRGPNTLSRSMLMSSTPRVARAAGEGWLCSCAALREGGRRAISHAAATGGRNSGRDWGQAVPPGRGQTVAVGISGGVDSAVAALILKEQGYRVVGVFMRNWDEGEEVGNQNCSVERDLRDAQGVCRQLGVPLHEADFVAKYWTQVFEEFLAQCARGLTPNPDLACNRHIKFDALLDFADSLGAPLVATGHYARLQPAPPHLWALPGATTDTSSSAPLASPQPPGGMEGDPVASPQLLKGADPAKDQTYFLASVNPRALGRVLFPVGGMQKGAVREVAAERGLLPADRRSSAGICFIGRRNFADFLTQYVPPRPGTYVCVDTGRALGPCPNVLAVTHGQRPGIGGAAERVYVVGKDLVSHIVYVCQGRDHPALFTRTALLRTPHWLSPSHAGHLSVQGFLRCQFKARYGQAAQDCTLVPLQPPPPAVSPSTPTFTLPNPPSGAVTSRHAWVQGGRKVLGQPTQPGQECRCGGTREASVMLPLGEAAEVGSRAPLQSTAGAAGVQAQHRGGVFQPSRYTRLLPQDSQILPGYLVAVFDSPAPAITPQQALVAYDGEVCLGTALIATPGVTLHEEEGGWGGSAEHD